VNKKVIATVVIILLSAPSLFFLTFMFGEIIGGNLGGFSHLLQTVPFLLGIVIVWRWARKK
jgi:hypothetical protein